MYQQIKQLADEALALQNKDRMDAALRDISALAKAGHARECAFQEAATTGTGALQYAVRHDIDGKITVDAAHVPMAEQLAGADTAEGGAQ
jgi:hypothetical protein